MNGAPLRAGQVIRYAYLWREEAERGQEEGLKDRPAVIVVLLQEAEDRTRVIVAPITHTPPADPADALAIPPATARRIGLDDRPQWVVFSDLNGFIWPGPDLRPLPGQPIETAIIGAVPAKFLATLNQRLQNALRARRARVTKRTEV